jgi:hypothetical protein
MTSADRDAGQVNSRPRPVKQREKSGLDHHSKKPAKFPHQTPAARSSHEFQDRRDP